MELATLAPPRDFSAFDWTVVAVYLAGLIAIGLGSSRRQHSTQEYFLANRRMRPFLVGVSLGSAYFSMISYIGTPGEWVQYGPVLSVFVTVAAIAPVVFVVGRWVIPHIMRLPITSAFELLEARLGRPVRQLGSLTYFVTRLIWMALILHTTARILVAVTGCDPRLGRTFRIGIGVITTIYTLFGGIRTVMITEAIQFSMMFLGAVLTAVSITARTGGLGAWWPHHWEPHWLVPPVFSLDPHVRVTAVGALISGILAFIASGSSDQASIQRFLTTRDVAAARRTFLYKHLINGLLTVLLGLVGAALLGFFRQHPEAMPPRATLARNGDIFFPYYVSHFLPAGVAGLVVASLLSASMSCLSSGTNATLTVLMTDFVGVSRAAAAWTEPTRLRITRGLSVGIGILVIFGSLGMDAVHGDLIEVTNRTVNLLVCPIFGLFFLALFVRYATPFGAVVGLLYSVTAAVLIGYWDFLTGSAPISFLWIMPVSFAVSVAAGCGFSLLPTRNRPVGRLAGYAAAAIIPLVGIVGWLLLAARRG